MELGLFRTQFSIKKDGVQNAIVSEGAAFLHGVRQLVKKRRWHGKKVAMLVDAQSLLFAIRKGRSSAYFLAPAVWMIGANCLAADLRIFPGYIPSAWNLADPPSRGMASRTKPHHKHSAVRSSMLDHVHSIRRSVRILKHRGAWPITSADPSSWCSSNSSSRYGQPSC